jgi:hypothetical protein
MQMEMMKRQKKSMGQSMSKMEMDEKECKRMNGMGMDMPDKKPMGKKMKRGKR